MSLDKQTNAMAATLLSKIPADYDVPGEPVRGRASNDLVDVIVLVRPRKAMKRLPRKSGLVTEILRTIDRLGGEQELAEISKQMGKGKVTDYFQKIAGQMVTGHLWERLGRGKYRILDKGKKLLQKDD